MPYAIKIVQPNREDNYVREGHGQISSFPSFAAAEKAVMALDLKFEQTVSVVKHPAKKKVS